jgi:AraC-like DNA-binding protein
VQYRELRVPPPLDALIECVWFLTTAPREGDTAAVGQHILPDGCIELVCHFGDRFLAVSRDRRHTPQPACFVVGMLTAPLTVVPAARSDTMGVRFRPGCAYGFFGSPLSEMGDCAIGLDDLWGAPARDLWEQLADAPDDAARVALISHALLNRLAGADADRVTAAAVADLVRSGGRASIDAIAVRAGVTTRHLQRRFAERVGATPKVLARILRFQNTLRLRASRPDGRTDWVRVAYACGYADQSHLIRDYAQFAGETPLSLSAAEGELSRYFTAPQRLAALLDARRYG